MPRYILLSFFFLLHQISFAQPDTSYKREWLEIDSLFRIKALPQSAVLKVNLLYKRAEKENKQAQVIKALLYKRILELQFKAQSINEEVKDLQLQITNAKKAEVHAILSAILADKYFTYFQNNRWRLYNRSNTIGFKKEDVETWSADDFHQAITLAYQNSLKNKEALKKISINKFEAILNLHSTNFYRPTLYDLLAHQALAYYKSDETYITQPANHFIIKQPEALAGIVLFSEFNFASADTVSNKWSVLLLYQDLLKFHQQQKDTAALIDVNLDRIQYVNFHGTFANKDSLYREALLQTAQAFTTNRFAADAWYLLAKYYSEKAQAYKPTGDTSKRYYYLKALEITQQFIPLKDSTKGHFGLYNLHQSILTTSLQTKTEQVVAPALPIKALIEYRNVNSLYYRIIKATDAVEDSLRKIWTDRQRNLSIFSLAKNFPYLRQEKITLPATGDYQPHSVEIKIDELPVGKYYILASNSPAFNDTDKLSWQPLVVSNISYTSNGLHYFVLHRITGKPLVDAKVVSTERSWNNSSRKTETIRRTYRTNSNGYFKLVGAKEYSQNISLNITLKNDRLDLDEEQYVPATNNNNPDEDEEENDEEYEEENAKAFFFLDRSIYRPGQTVYFKILALTKNGKSKKTKIFTKISSKDSLFIYLKNVNDEEVDSVLIVLNEYGSFAGKFVLPANTLTGEFSLEAEFPNDDFTHTFSVEEYKRPTFFVEIKKPEGTYKLQQRVTTVLRAQAYAGNAADGATIKYTVTRTGRFLYPWRWFGGNSPGSNKTIITTGEASTSAEGNYTIEFEALADEEINKDQMPVFDFKIDADVTDRSGETRSASTTVSIGYHSLNLKLNVPENAEADSLKNIFVLTTNLAGDKQPASVQVRIYPLISPQHPIKKSHWQQPDQFIYSKEEFKKHFPNEEYKNENDKNLWKKGAVIFTSTINTKDSGKIIIPKGTLIVGWHLVEAITIDKEGNEIKDVKYVQIFSKQAGQFNSNNYLFTNNINNSVAIGQAANFLIGTPASDVFLIQQIERKALKSIGENQTEFIFHSLNKNVKSIKVLPHESDKSLGVSFVFIKDNRCYTWQQQVYIQPTDNVLDIDVLTYRNKIEPGSKETWTVKIKGPDKEAAAAEVLTSMYDASLNQFKPHQWSVPQLSSYSPSFSGFNSNISFKAQSAYQNNFSRPSIFFNFIYPAIDIHMQDAHQKSLINNQKNKNPLKDNTGRFIEENFMGDDFSPGDVRFLTGKVAGVDVQMNDVVVTGYGLQSKGTPGTSTSIRIRGASSVSGNNGALVIVDGKIVGSTSEVNPDDIANIEVLKDAAATALYGVRGANGVIIITTKNAQKPEDVPVKIRSNFNETAFFFPQLHTDTEGNLSFTFTLPDALTQWNWQVLAHDKLGNIGLQNKTIVSQKTLMVQMNAPRFLREGDKITLSAKISNLSTDGLAGKASLQLLDAVTGLAVDAAFSNTFRQKNFVVNAAQSTSVNFDIAVPVGFTNPVTWKIIATAASFGDGEENTIPILSNRMLVTESFPLFIRGDGTKNFQFNNLLNSKSATLQHQSVTVEYTSNPIWNVIQALPYLMEYPYECAEQIFNRVYANALASTIIRNNPGVQQVFNEWMKDSTALLSNLEKNQELKSILLQETPWVLQAKSEAQQKKDISLLFQVIRLSQEMKKNIEKLKQMQMANGAFPWFNGGSEDRHITQYILTGIGRLKKMNALPANLADEFESITKPALRFLNKMMEKDYEDLKNNKVDLKANNLQPIQLQYLYMRSFFPDDATKKLNAYQYYYKQAKTFWVQQSSYFKAMTGAILLPDEPSFVTNNILPALIENAIMDKDSAMYWKDNLNGYYWHQAAVEQQVLTMELMHDAYVKTSKKMYADRLNDMKTWLLKQKQTNHWNTTKSTADACYVLVSTGTNAIADNRSVKISLGENVIQSSTTKKEAGSGYIKQTIAGNKVSAAMGNISIVTTSEKQETLPSYGAVYWQYFEQLDKIRGAKETPFTIEKKLFKELKTSNGIILQPINSDDELRPGEKVIVRIVLKTDRNMEYIHLKDMRAAGTEPVNVISRYKWQDGLGYYESTRDASTNFFIGYMPVGTYVFEYPVFVTHAGNFSVGIATAQCMYAPEFSSHSEGINIKVQAWE